jgi:ABC-type phosphate/phosphonate transport system permease subunit
MEYLKSSELFSFPNPVNEKAARTVAGVVFVVSIVTLATSWYWLLVPLAYGFVARTLTGPTLSPLGRLASSRIAPALGPSKPVPGPPKRFAQAIGATLTTAAAILALAAGQQAAADGLLAAMVFASGLESIFAYCVGCKIFGLLMRAGVVPSSICAECADIWSRPSAARQ